MFKAKWYKSGVLKELIHAASWSLVGAILSRILTLLGSVIVARTLSKSEFGEYSLVLSTVYLFAGASSFGLNIIATKLVAERKIEQGDISSLINGLTKLIFALSMAGVVAFILLGDVIAGQVHEAHALFELMLYGSIFLFGMTVAGVQSAIFFGLDGYKQVAIGNMAQSIFSVLLTVILVDTLGAKGALAGLGIAQAFQCICFQYLISKSVKPFRGASRDNTVSFSWVMQTLGQSAPVFLSAMMVMPVTWVQNMLLAKQQNGLAEIAVVGLAGQWKMAILFIPGILSSIIVPRMIKFDRANDSSGYYKFFRLNLYICLILGVILLGAAIVLSYAVGFIYGDAYVRDQWVFVIFSFVAVLMAINGVIGQVIISLGRVWLGLAFNFSWACVVIVSTYYFVIDLSLGAIGVAYSYVAAYLLHCVWQFAFVTVHFQNRIQRTSEGA